MNLQTTLTLKVVNKSISWEIQKTNQKLILTGAQWQQLYLLRKTVTLQFYKDDLKFLPPC
jgi:hypothetical protein